MNRFAKAGLIGIGALILSTFAIHASDSFRGVGTDLSGLLSQSNTGPCQTGAIQILLGSHAICMDTYEASPSDSCAYTTITSGVQTQSNLNTESCVPVSREGAQPWRYVSFTQAQQLCARVHKRLSSNAEWYASVSGQTENGCVVANGSSPEHTGEADCVSPSGVHDLIGNVWEWVSAQVQDGQYDGRSVPVSGYVSAVDTNGVVLKTSEQANPEFGDDYAWTNASGTRGMIRGGFYDSDDDAGIFAQNMAVPLDFKTAGVGFRCVQDI